MAKIKTGILGCGVVGLWFIEESKKHQGFEVIALCSKNESSLNKASQLAPHARRYLNKKSFFQDSEIEAIIVCTPHEHHAADAILSLHYGKHTLIEKPIATNKIELHKLITKSIQNPNKTVTALPHGNYEFMRITQDLINSNAIGKITSLHSYLDVPGPPRSNWYYLKSAVGGASLGTLPYALCRVLMLLQMNVSNAFGLKNQLIHHRICDDGGRINPEVDDNATLLLLFKEGQQAIVRTNWNIASVEDFLIIHGRQGEICIDVGRNTITLKSLHEINIPNMVKIKDKTYRAELKNIHSERLKLDVFLDQINKNSSNLQEVAYSMNIIFSLLSKNGRLSLPPPFYADSQSVNSLLISNDYM